MSDYGREFRKKVRDFKRELVRTELNKRTENQITFFNRMYKSIDDIEETDMENAYSQCKMTEKKERNALKESEQGEDDEL